MNFGLLFVLVKLNKVEDGNDEDEIVDFVV